MLAQKNSYASSHNQEKGKYTKDLPDFNYTLQLEETADTTANVSFGDGDSHLDILLVKGRHWPIVDRVLRGDGKGRIRKAYNLGKVADRLYTGGWLILTGTIFLMLRSVMIHQTQS